MNLGTATGSPTKAADPDLIIKAVDHLIGLTRDAIILQQRAAALAQHPVFGTLAAPLRQMAKPFVDAYNDLLRRLDDQLPNIDVTHHLDLRLTLGKLPALGSFLRWKQSVGLRIFDDRDCRLVV
jgi:hypothetical protein